MPMTHYPYGYIELDCTYESTDYTYKFGPMDMPTPVGLGVIHQKLIDVDEASDMQIRPGKGIGYRPTVSIRIADWNNDSHVQGVVASSSTVSFWALLKANVEIMTNLDVRWIQGSIDVDTMSFTAERTLQLVSTRFEGPSNEHEVTIECGDIFTRITQSRAFAPKISDVTLLSAIGTGDTSATMSDTTDTIGASGYLRIGTGDEIIGFTKTGTSLSLTRAQKGTSAEAYDAGDAVQQIVIFEDADIADVLHTLYTEYGGYTVTGAEKTDWDAEEDLHLSDYKGKINATLWEPEEVGDLIDDMMTHLPFTSWPDPETAQIRFEAIKVNETITEDIDATDTATSKVVADSVDIVEETDGVANFLWIYYGLIDPSGDLEDPTNYASATPYQNVAATSTRGELVVRKIFSRWLGSGESALVASLGVTLTRTLAYDARLVTLEVWSDDTSLNVGDYTRLTSPKITDKSGSTVAITCIVVSASYSRDRSIRRYVLEDLRLTGRYCRYAPDLSVTYDTATDEQKDKYGFYADASGKVGTVDDDGYSYA